MFRMASEENRDCPIVDRSQFRILLIAEKLLSHHRAQITTNNYIRSQHCQCCMRANVGPGPSVAPEGAAAVLGPVVEMAAVAATRPRHPLPAAVALLGLPVLSLLLHLWWWLFQPAAGCWS